ncbi:4197_t:CDS:1 [Ambispora gerdemannii]|uniref:4197_t:CDS:1 n=1 Tax=Ambispora gerdemannii TaxID=144530 RepID=A0A9N9H1H4_9GLOM|nr:4197_t:CDS:1 [Ambispora gerdemannii]
MKRHISTILDRPPSPNAIGIDARSINEQVLTETGIGHQNSRNLNEKSGKDDISSISSTENFHALTCSIPVQPLESTYRPSRDKDHENYPHYTNKRQMVIH